MPVNFSPKGETRANNPVIGSLTVKASDSVKCRQIKLIGYGTVSLALDEVDINLACSNNFQNFKLNIPNPTGYNVKFAFTTNIDGLIGPAFLNVKANDTAIYAAKIKGLRRGLEAGKKLVFTALTISKDDEKFTTLPDNHEIIRSWYCININTQPGEAVDTIKLCCPVQHEQEIGIILPIKDRRFTARIYDTSENKLLPCSDFSLSSNVVQNSMKIKFSPQMPKNSNVRLILTPNDTSQSELWYNIEGSVLEPAPKLIDDIVCCVGASYYKNIQIKNPTKQPMYVQLSDDASNTNECFTYDKVKTKVEPCTEIDIPIRFNPCDIGSKKSSGHQTRIRVDTFGLLGVLLFDLIGTGISPIREAPTCVYARRNVSTPSIITFKNPTKYAVIADLALEQSRDLLVLVGFVFKKIFKQRK